MRFNMTFYDFSGGMESAAMLVLDRERIRSLNAVVRWADTGKQFPEMADSIKQIEKSLSIKIEVVKAAFTFDEFLFDRGGMLRKGIPDCSRRMKRKPLMEHLQSFDPPYEINLGFNSSEVERMDDFIARNERPFCHWRFPLIEQNVSREDTWGICEKAGFTILVGMYKKMGRFDCFWCPNQTPRQALRVVQHYPDLAKQWADAEVRKGHPFLAIPLPMLVKNHDSTYDTKQIGCSCFGGTEDMWSSADDYDPPPAKRVEV